MEKLYVDLLKVAKNLSFNDAEDLVQSTFERAMVRNLPLDIRILITVLKGIHYNKVKRDSLPIHYEIAEEVPPEVDEGFSEPLLRALMTLTDLERDVFMERYLMERTPQEIAKRWGRSAKTISNLLSKSKKKLQKVLDI